MNAEVVVVGAGVIGSAIALELSRAGRDVLVVDKARGVGHGSTSASSAVVRFTFSTAAGVAAAWESKQHWTAWEDYLGFRPETSTRYVQCGLALLDVDLAPRVAYLPLLTAAGVPFEEWDAEELGRRIPGVDTGRYWPPKRISDDAFWDDATASLGAIYTPDGGFVTDPQLAAQNLADAARAHGARFALGHAVVAVERDEQRVRGIRLDDGTLLSSPIVVNAAGPWSGRLNQLASVGDDFTIGVRAMRQEVHQVSAPKGYIDDQGVGIGFADMDLGIYVRTEGDGHLMIGGTEPECDPMVWLDDPDETDPRPSNAVFEAQVTRAARRLPELTVPNRATGVAGVYDVADDWTPIYDRTDLDGWFVAMGTSGNQFKNAPVVGQFMRAIIDHVQSGADHDADPVQWPAPLTGNTVDLGAFSRRRPINKGNSGTVLG
jgi:sarcosine oxidase, subunit beta